MDREVQVCWRLEVCEILRIQDAYLAGVKWFPRGGGGLLKLAVWWYCIFYYHREFYISGILVCILTWVTDHMYLPYNRSYMSKCYSSYQSLWLGGLDICLQQQKGISLRCVNTRKEKKKKNSWCLQPQQNQSDHHATNTMNPCVYISYLEAYVQNDTPWATSQQRNHILAANHRRENTQRKTLRAVEIAFFGERNILLLSPFQAFT